MKISKKIYIGLFAVVMAMCLMACGKTAVSAATFEDVAWAMGLEIYDYCDEFADDRTVDEALIAYNERDNWQVEFYVMRDQGYAASAFNNLCDQIDDERRGGSSSSFSGTGSASYSVTSNGIYYVAEYVGDTVIFIREDERYKNDIKAFLKELGY